jgi:hypothetical protein
LESGWALSTALGVGISILRNLPLAHIGGRSVEDETAMEAVPDSKSGERATAGSRVLRHLLATTQPVEGAALIKR